MLTFSPAPRFARRRCGVLLPFSEVSCAEIFVPSLGVPHTASAVAAFLVRQGRRFFCRFFVANIYM
jgi:hypothetical protein